MYDIPAGVLPPGTAVKCGNRLDLPQKERRHSWVDLGPDVRNCAARGFLEGVVRVCSVCGTDKFTKGACL